MKKISLMIPVYNEEQCLNDLIEELFKIINSLNSYKWEILFINDGSIDNSLNLIKNFHEKDNRISYVDLSRNFGKENAMLAGFDYIVGDCVIIMDADLQDPPSLMPEMISYWEKGFDDVYARRIERGDESWLRKRLSLTYYRWLQKMTKVDILPNVGDFRLLDRRCINVLKSLRENERYSKGLYAWIGFNKKELTFNRSKRIEGHSSWSYFSLFKLAINGITSFTIAPLRLSIITGLIVSFIAFISMIYYLVKTLIYGDVVQGFPTLIVIILFLGGLQLFTIGIIGEYLGRVFIETKRRPVYLANEYNGKKVEY